MPWAMSQDPPIALAPDRFLVDTTNPSAESSPREISGLEQG
jgi:hypothetical protein